MKFLIVKPDPCFSSTSWFVLNESGKLQAFFPTEAEANAFVSKECSNEAPF